MPGQGGMVMHAEVEIGNSRLMLAEARQSAPSSSSFYLYVKDVDALYKRAIGAGAISESEPTDQFWGDRIATVKDLFGNTWSIATHKEDVTPQEMAKRLAALVR
jgi:PhnB protein